MSEYIRKKCQAKLSTLNFFSSIFFKSHLVSSHLPQTAKYACGSCRETFLQLSDYKAHESNHSKDKLPYTCYICDGKYARARDFNK